MVSGVVSRYTQCERVTENMLHITHNATLAQPAFPAGSAASRLVGCVSVQIRKRFSDVCGSSKESV